MTLELITIERLQGGIITITYNADTEIYINVSLREAERMFRETYGLQGRKLEKVLI